MPTVSTNNRNNLSLQELSVNEAVTRALAVRQPHAWAICAGVKGTENRTWSTNYRGTIAIHAGTSRREVREFRESTECELIQPEWFHFGAIIGLADIVDVSVYGFRFERDPFACGPFCWSMENPRLLKNPIPLRGRLNLFKLDVAIQERLRQAEACALDLDEDVEAKTIAEAMTSESDWPIGVGYDALFDHFLDTGEYEDVVDAATKTIELDSDWMMAYDQRGRAYHLWGKYEQAIADFSRALDLVPEDVDCLAMRAESLSASGRREAALADLERAIALDPDDQSLVELRAELTKYAG